MKPNFMVIGSGKAGTHSLCVLLEQHPDVFIVEGKEPNFFSLEEVYERGVDWYESLYAQAGERSMRGDGSPLYTFSKVFPQAAPRIAEYAPDLRLIYIVRHPLERIESAWMEMRSWTEQKVDASFNRAVKLNRDWLVDSTNYWQEINVYRRYYSDDRILIVFFEDLKSDPSALLRRCFEFLGIDREFPVDLSAAHRNPSDSKRVPHRLVWMARSIPLARKTYLGLMRIMPAGLHEFARRRLLRRAMGKRPEWEDASRRWVLETLREDTARLLEFCGKPAGFWDLRG